MQLLNKKDSIYFQLIRLMLVSVVAAGIAFVLLNRAGEYVMDHYFYTSEYIEKKDRTYVQKLQSYITKNQLSSDNTAALSSWVKAQAIISVDIYKDDILIFNSDYPDADVREEEIAISFYDWDTYYSVEFSDGEALAGIYGSYAYQSYNVAFIVELMVSFLLFLVLMLLGVRKKMNYISKLSEEIRILEGGSLDYRISVEGKDELAVLAEGLDNMRLSFRDLIEQEVKLMRENQKMITEMSHDIRTPVTSIMLYTEILKKGRYENDAQLMTYIEKIDRKAHRMKQLTDHLFEYSLVSGDMDIVPEAPEKCETLFYDLFSETCSYLEQQGFKVDFRVVWSERCIRIHTDYISRILDNITSNIIKYADPERPVVICSKNTEAEVGFLFENAICRRQEKVESTQVGVQSVRKMMVKMGGVCEVQIEDGVYRILISFPARP